MTIPLMQLHGWQLAGLLLASSPPFALARYPDGRPLATLRMEAADQGVVLKHGDGPGQCDVLGAREALNFADHGVLEKLGSRGVDRIAFVKRFTYDANHYYTEYINSTWRPGGNLCILNLKTGAVVDLLPQLKGGVFERFDVSFDATRLVFAWKAAPNIGYRIFEVHVDGTGLRQLTFPQPDEADLVKKYSNGYHHGTDDMQPCYLPDGGIVFISTRCQYGILCDPPDIFTTTVLYRMDADGRNMRKLSNSSVSEASPAMLPDGRVMYTRWEYVDKGAVSVKCLWAMKPDGTASAEIYGNDIALPPTFIYGRAIPDSPNKYVMLGTPHSSPNAIGTVIRLDMTKNIRNREPMTYMTPDVDIREERGYSFTTPGGDWQFDPEGKGRLFKDPYPLSEKLFLVAHKPAGKPWSDPLGYGLYLLSENGGVENIFTDPEISCWLPYPLTPRPTPPVLSTSRDAKLAETKQAACVVTDVYDGLEEVPAGRSNTSGFWSRSPVLGLPAAIGAATSSISSIPALAAGRIWGSRCSMGWFRLRTTARPISWFPRRPMCFFRCWMRITWRCRRSVRL